METSNVPRRMTCDSIASTVEHVNSSDERSNQIGASHVDQTNARQPRCVQSNLLP